MEKIHSLKEQTLQQNKGFLGSEKSTQLGETSRIMFHQLTTLMVLAK
jgi:hypothetical protein